MGTLANDKKKYRHPDFDDQQVESLLKYFKIEGYPNLLPFLKKLRNN
jgi:hypothetical protein